MSHQHLAFFIGLLVLLFVYLIHILRAFLQTAFRRRH